MAVFGIVHFNNVTDANLITILQAKEKAGNSLVVNVANLQGQQAQQGKITYVNVPVQWLNAEGAKIVADLILELAK